MSSASKKHINFPDECLIPLFLEYPAPKFFLFIIILNRLSVFTNCFTNFNSDKFSSS